MRPLFVNGPSLLLKKLLMEPACLCIRPQNHSDFGSIMSQMWLKLLMKLSFYEMSDFRRFVAGAICPNCKKKDTIALSADDKRIFCVSCNFEERKSE